MFIVPSLLDSLVSGAGHSSAIMPLHYKLKDESAPLGELDIRQVDMLRFHMGSDRNIGVGVKFLSHKSLTLSNHADAF